MPCMSARKKAYPVSTNNKTRVVVITAVLIVGALGIGFWKFKSSRPASDAENGPPGAIKPIPRQNDAATFAQYAGSQSCRDCHAAAFDNWQRSHHALAERAMDLALDKAAFDPAREIKHGTQASQASFTAGHFQLHTPGLKQNRESFRLDRVIGVEPLRQFLVAGERGRFQVTELAFDPGRREWFDVFGEEDRQPGEWGHWTGRGMTWNQMCAGCHNTRLRKNYNPTTDSYFTAMVEVGVGCEACHGPLKNHAQWQKGRPQPAKSDPTIRRPDRELTLATCGSCHARRGELTGDFAVGDRFLDHFVLMIPDESDLYYADGQVRDENYEYASFLSSKMFAAGVTCMDCHEPHSAKLRTLDDSLCQRCHAPPVLPAPRIDPAAHSHHKPETPGGRCVDCHMPLTTYMQRHPRRDHGFTIPDPLLTAQHGIPNACNRCHTDRDTAWALATVENWYGERMNRPSRFRAQTVAKARAGDTNAVPNLMGLAREEKIPLWRAAATRLLERWADIPEVKTALLERVGDADPLVRVQAAHALAPLVEGSDARALNSLRFLLNDSVRAVRVEAAWALHGTLETNSVAGQELFYSLDLNSDQPSGAFQFGMFWMDRGNPGEALRWFERAVNWDGRSAPLRDALAVCLSTLGRSADAVRELEAACQLAPKDAHYRYKLGLAFNEVGKLAEAVGALEESVKLDPQLAQAWYNLGLAYSASGRLEEGLQASTRAESIDGASARIPYARATILARLGRIDEARRAATRALEIQRDHREAAALLEQLQQSAR
ncbi:MAG: tetratricopeptide repeat protein [Verrucomicrobia bacterium]|nr:tetratricopeptide repeat protein [Verrucomicrobiota bacterium]